MIRPKAAVVSREPRHACSLGVLLKEQFAGNARRRADHRDWPGLQVRQYPLRDTRVVTHEVCLRDAGRWVDYALRMRDFQLRLRARRLRFPTLPDNCAWRLVDTQTSEGGLPDDAIGGPVRKLDLCDEFGAHPALAAGRAPGPAAVTGDSHVERRRIRFKGRQPRPQVPRRPGVPAGADASGVMKLAVSVVAKQQAANLAVLAAPASEAADDQFLPKPGFRLEPRL